MSLTYKFNMESGNDPVEEDEPVAPEENKDIENYSTPGNTRNVCFVDAEGNEEFFNYGYLVKGKYSPEESTIVLTFTSDVVTLKGRNLAGLFNELVGHVPKKIVVCNKRYETSKETADVFVTEITIT